MKQSYIIKTILLFKETLGRRASITPRNIFNAYSNMENI